MADHDSTDELESRHRDRGRRKDHSRRTNRSGSPHRRQPYMAPPAATNRPRFNGNRANQRKQAKYQRRRGNPPPSPHGLTPMGFAAAYYIDDLQGPHRSLISYCRPLLGKLNQTAETYRDVLDYMALILARFKGQGSRETTSTRNVTATLLEENNSYHWTIWIAKNGGPQNFNGLRDSDFISTLSNWFSPTPDFTDEDMQQCMGQFWQMRYDHHLSQISPKFNEMERRARADGHNDTRVMLIAHYQHVMRDLFDLADLNRDWNLVESIATGNNSIPFLGNGSHQLPWSDQEYPRRMNSISDRDPTHSEIGADCFRKLVKSVKRLYAVETAMIAFQRFRQMLRSQNTTLTLRFLDTQPRHSITKNELLNGFLDLRNQLAPPNQAVPGTIQVHQRLDELQTKIQSDPSPSTPLYFHCELQLLKRFERTPTACKYIGCSKLSCCSCWLVLEHSNANFTTKGSHGRLHWQCTFPGPNMDAHVTHLHDILMTDVRNSANSQLVALFNAISQSLTPPRVELAGQLPLPVIDRAPIVNQEDFANGASNGFEHHQAYNPQRF